MQVEVIFYTSCAFLLTVFVVSMVLAARGNQAAQYFLWVWAALMTEWATTWVWATKATNKCLKATMA